MVNKKCVMCGREGAFIVQKTGEVLCAEHTQVNQQIENAKRRI